MEQPVLIGDDIYEVQEIVGMKKSDKGHWLYRVRWKGYGSQSDTWEPEKNLALCKDMIVEYRNKNAHKSSKKTVKGQVITTETVTKIGESIVVGVVKTAPSEETDTFWKDLSEGRIHILDEDMYSRVKGRAAKKSRKAQESNQSSPKESPTHEAAATEITASQPVAATVVINQWRPNPIRKRKTVLQTLSQSFDNSMNSIEMLRKKHFKKSKKCWTQKVVAKKRSRSFMKVEQVSCSPGKLMLKIKGHQKIERKKKTPKIPKSEVVKTANCNSTPELSIFKELTAAIENHDCNRISSLYGQLESTDSESILILANNLLLSAATEGHWPCIETLISSGVNVNSLSSIGISAMMIACLKGNDSVVERLLEQGARKDNQDEEGQTALMIACSKGHLSVVRLLLNSGSNFAYVNNDGMNALRLAKLSNHLNIQELLTSHISRLTAAFETEVRSTVTNTAHIVHALFPLHCFSISENTNFNISFDHECQLLKPGIGYLLFIAHADVALSNVRCRLYGPCAVQSVKLNSRKQPSLTEGANFVFSFCPLHNGKNVVSIITEEAPNSNVKLLVCAYKAELVRQGESSAIDT